MKKRILRILFIFLALLAAYLVFNQFDAKPIPMEFTDEGQLPEDVYDYNNGFYRLWTLTEPPETDIQSEKVLIKYRRLFDPGFDNDRYIKEFDSKTYKAMNRKFQKRWQQALKHKGDWAKPLFDPIQDWVDLVLADKADIRALQRDFSHLQNRYRQLIDCSKYRDFTLPRWDSPVPNLLAWLRLSKLYTAINMLDAMEGNWEKGTANLLDQVDSGKKINGGSRTLIANLVAKAIARLSIEALASLMNQAECPTEVFTLILERTPPLRFEEYGSPPIVFEYRFRPEYNWKRFNGDPELNFFEALWYTLFTQPNRTRNYRDRQLLEVIKTERILPHQWKTSPFDIQPIRKGWFWWLQNPGGKIIMDQFAHGGGKNMATVILKSYKVKTTYEMLRIAAELRLHYTPDKSVQEILNGLPAYKSFPDPCSGKPYIWNGKKQILYSIGTDLKDDGGQPQRDTIFGDFVLPVVLYVR